jgi:hypothetical protein
MGDGSSHPLGQNGVAGHLSIFLYIYIQKENVLIVKNQDILLINAQNHLKR